MEESAWIRSCTNIFSLRRDSNDPGTIIMGGGDNKSLESLLDFKENIIKTIEELDTLEFDIFELK